MNDHEGKPLCNSWELISAQSGLSRKSSPHRMDKAGATVAARPLIPLWLLQIPGSLTSVYRTRCGNLRSPHSEFRAVEAGLESDYALPNQLP